MAEIKEGWNVDIKNLALVDYQQPISEAVLPCINEWYRRHLEIAAQKKQKIKVGTHEYRHSKPE